MRIRVNGIPAPQGSKRHVGGGRMAESSRAVGPWREAVRSETQRAMAGVPVMTRPVAAFIRFYLPRPASAPARVAHPARRPDLDKLGRAVLDGLTDGGAWADDAQVVQLLLKKEYAAASTTPGCDIEIREIRQ